MVEHRNNNSSNNSNSNSKKDDNSGFSENYNPNEHMRQGHHTLDEIKNSEGFEITNMHKTKTGNNVVTVANPETNEIQTFPSVKDENLEGLKQQDE